MPSPRKTVRPILVNMKSMAATAVILLMKLAGPREPKNRSAGPAAKSGTHAGALAGLKQNDQDQGQRDNDVQYNNYCKHTS